MNKDVEFLNYIYQNAKMGVVGIDNIKNKIKNKELNDLIATQRSEYETISNTASGLLEEKGYTEKDISTFAKIMTYTMSNLSMLKDDSSNNIAKMMIEGSNKGIIEITEKLNAYDHADEEIEKLAKKLLVTEQHNVEELKSYL